MYMRVNFSHALKGGASLLLHHCYAVIALWHRGAFCGNFRFPRHHKNLAYPEVPAQPSPHKVSSGTKGAILRGVPSLLFERVYLHARTSLLPTANELRNWGDEESVLCSTFSQQNHTLVLYRMREYIRLCVPQYNSARRPEQDSKKEGKRENRMMRSLSGYLKQQRGTIPRVK